MVSSKQHTEHGEVRKEQILRAAERLFSARGYGATRIADICADAGVAKGLFYWYFPTKQVLFGELVRAMRLDLRRTQAAAMDPDASPLTRIRQGAEASVRFMAEHQAYFALLDVERSDESVAGVLRQGSDVYAADIVRLLVEAQRLGLVDDTDPHVLAIGVMGAVSSFSNARRNGRIDVDDETLALLVGEWVTRALAGEPARPAARRVGA